MTLLSTLHSPSRQNHIFGHKKRMVQPDSLNVGSMGRDFSGASGKRIGNVVD
jgi:hypothetical protein